ncbi:methionyl-tRNA formyltransferase, partial [Candidatus Magnetomorum sp. HK-1]
MVKHKVELIISHAFMKILPKTIFAVPKYGCINIHPSLLPNYRGASPTKMILCNKEKETGLTSHYIDEGIDTGNIIYQVKIPVYLNDTVE